MAFKIRKYGKKVKAKIEYKFIGRNKQKDIFWDNYKYLKQHENDDESKILSYYGMTSGGKTSFCNNLIEEIDAKNKKLSSKKQIRYIYHDFKKENDFKQSLQDMCDDLKERYNYFFPMFDYSWYVYKSRIGLSQDSDEMKAYVKNSKILKYMVKIIGNVPVDNAYSVFTKYAKGGNPVLRKFIAKHQTEVKNIENAKLSTLENMLIAYFARDLWNNMSVYRGPFVVFFDSFEHLNGELMDLVDPINNDLWLRNIEEGNEGLMLRLPNTLWVILGRESLKWHDIDEMWDESALEQHELENLCLEETIEYLNYKDVNEKDLCEGLYNLTGGNIIDLNSCVEKYEKLTEMFDEPNLDNFTNDYKSISNDMLKYIDDETKELLFLMASNKEWDEKSLNKQAKQNDIVINKVKYKNIVTSSYVDKISDKNGGTYKLCDEFYNILSKVDYDFKSVEKSQADNYINKELQDKNESDVNIDSQNKDLNDNDEELSTENEMTLNEADDSEVGNNDSDNDFDNESVNNEALNDDNIDNEDVEEINVIEDFNTQEELIIEEDIEEFYTEDINETINETTNEDVNETIGDTNVGEATNNIFEDNQNDTFKVNFEDNQDGAKMSYEGKKNALLLLLNEYKFDEFEKEFAPLWENVNNKYDMTEYLLFLGIKLIYEVQKSNFYEVNQIVYEIESKREDTEFSNAQVSDIDYSLARAYYFLEDYDKAFNMDTMSYELRHTTYKDEHIDTMLSMMGLGADYLRLGQKDKARELVEKAYDLETKLLGSDSVYTLKTYGLLAKVYSVCGDNEKAFDMSRDLYEKSKKILGKENPNTILALKNIGTIYFELSMYQEAFNISKKIKSKYEKVLGTSHKFTILSYEDISNICEILNLIEEACNLKEKVYNGFVKLYGEGNKKTIMANYEYMRLCMQNKKEKDVVSRSEEAYKMCSNLYGEENEYAVMMLRMYGDAVIASKMDKKLAKNTNPNTLYNKYQALVSDELEAERKEAFVEEKLEKLENDTDDDFAFESTTKEDDDDEFAKLFAEVDKAIQNETNKNVGMMDFSDTTNTDTSKNQNEKFPSEKLSEQNGGIEIDTSFFDTDGYNKADDWD